MITKSNPLLAPLASLALATVAYAGNVAIENAQVASGQVSFEGLQSDHATITQFSDKAIVDYQRFDVMAGAASISTSPRRGPRSSTVSPARTRPC